MYSLSPSPQAWNETNDEYATAPGMKPWIAEMYGYAFGAARADVWHKIDYAAMLYPGKKMAGAVCKCAKISSTHAARRSLGWWYFVVFAAPALEGNVVLPTQLALGSHEA